MTIPLRPSGEEVMSEKSRDELMLAIKTIMEAARDWNPPPEGAPQEWRTLHSQARSERLFRLSQAVDQAFSGLANGPRKPEEQAVRDEWKPIESAPKDGLPFLAWIPFTRPPVDGGCVNIIEWDYEEDGWREWEGHMLGGHVPTHWMPLPQPPSDTERK